MKEARILLVENDPDYAELIINIFELEHIKGVIVLFKDGQEAIDYIQKEEIDRGNGIQSQIGLIILDLNLPKVHGMDVLKFIKKNSKYCSIPVIIFSTSSDQKTIDEAYENGADGFISKLVSYEDFVEMIKILKSYCSY